MHSDGLVLYFMGKFLWRSSAVSGPWGSPRTLCTAISHSAVVFMSPPSDRDGLSLISSYLPSIRQERRSLVNIVHLHLNVVVLTCLPHVLLFDFRHSDLFRAARGRSKWTFSPPRLPLFPMTIKGQKHALWPCHLPCISSFHSHSPSFLQLPSHICPQSHPF